VTRSSHRFRFPGIADDGRLDLDEASSHKAIRVLRLEVGDRISIVDDTGAEFEADILSIKEGRVRIMRGACTRPAAASSANVSAPESNARMETVIALALIKPDRFDWAVEKMGETTIGGIWPFAAERSPVKTVSPSRIERWRKIAVSAALQSGRGVECPIREPAPNLDAILSAAKSPWHLDPGGTPAGRLIRDNSAAPDLIFVGPEGGWSDDERALLATRSRAISVGDSILRAESAALIAALLPSLLLSN
jgi:16S rRNA (uracil1498-N3)-methyltransferase